MTEVPIGKKVVAASAEASEANRARFAEAGVLVVNLMSSPGAGKTSLLERTVKALPGEVRLAVIEGDIETDRDAARVRALGVKAVQITTHGACHLDAKMVARSLEDIELDAIDLLLIENVGNLVCPANFDLGEDTRVVVSSTPEGDDKPLKYPEAFHGSQLCVLNKVDLAPHVDFDTTHFANAVHAANPQIRIIETSCRTGQGIDEWSRWLTEGLKAKRAGRPRS